MIIRSALIFLSLCACLALMVQPVRAQAPSPTVEPSPVVPQSTAEQIDFHLSAAVQQVMQKKWEEANQSATRALVLSKSIGDLTHQLKATNIVAVACFRSGLTGEAIRRFKEAAEIAAMANDKNKEAVALSRAGSLLRVSGLYDEALHCFSRAIVLYREEKNRSGEVLALTSLSTVYSETGDFAKARQLLQQALPIASELNDKVLDEALLLKLGIVEYECGNHELALKFGMQALALDAQQDREAIDKEIGRSFEQTRDIQPRTFALTRLELYLHLGNVYSALADYEKALEFFGRLLDHSKRSGRPLIAAVSLGGMAGAQLRLGKAKEARDLAIEALTNLRNSGGSKHWEATLLYYLAEANRALGLNDEALVSYRQAIDAIEQARSLSIPTEVSRAGIVSARHEVFAGAIAFFLSQHREEEALATAEAWHARAFLDILTESRIDLQKDLSAAQREQEDKSFGRISGIQKELWSAGLSPAREQGLKTELGTAESALEAFQLEVHRTNPLYASIKYPRPVKPAVIAGELIDEGTALIEYVLGDKQSFALVVYRGRISSYVLPPKKEIEEKVTSYRAAISARVSALTTSQSSSKLKAQSHQLYQLLLQPMTDQLKDSGKLIIVPDGLLSYLPFETLVAEDNKTSAEPRYLLETHAVTYTPSASALFAIKHSKAPAIAKGLLAFGDPIYADAVTQKGSLTGNSAAFQFRNLPYTRTEVNDIGSLFSSPERHLFLGAAAREQTVKAEPLDQYRYIHFAAHGVIDEEFPARSGIMLSAAGDTREDGMLQMSEVMRLKLKADLVTLSACRSGMGKLVNGEGIIGLTRSFLYAGADGVVVSLWDVNDLSTAALMKSFYTNLKQGLPKDEALRRAKLQMLQGQRRTWQYPYYWAPFVLVGAGN